MGSGSDAIFASLIEAVQMVGDGANLTAEEKRAILDENAARMLGAVGRATTDDLRVAVTGGKNRAGSSAGNGGESQC